MTDQPRGALQRLITERMLELGLSYRDVAERGGLSRSTVHHLATSNGSSGIPRPATLEGLAVGLDLPLGVVRAAAAAEAGLFVEATPASDPETEVLIASLARLSASERRHVAALVQSLLKDRAQPQDS